MTIPVEIIVTVVLVLLGSVTAYYAKKRGRDPIIWFLLGMFFGLLGLLLLFLMPSLAENEKTIPNTLSTSVLPNTVSVDYPKMVWYYLDSSHKQQGPVTFDALRSMWSTASLFRNSLVWCEGMVDWKRIEELPQLEEKLSSSETELIGESAP